MNLRRLLAGRKDDGRWSSWGGYRHEPARALTARYPHRGSSWVELAVYDVTGKQVAVLADRRLEAALATCPHRLSARSSVLPRHPHGERNGSHARIEGHRQQHEGCCEPR